MYLSLTDGIRKQKPNVADIMKRRISGEMGIYLCMGRAKEMMLLRATL